VFSATLQIPENRETKLFILKINFKEDFLIRPWINSFRWQKLKTVTLWDMNVVC